jgi:HD superfamily phosphohydrolase
MEDKAIGKPYVKIINDQVHGHIPMPQYCIEFIDTPQFQRLRGLKQLGEYFGLPFLLL